MSGSRPGNSFHWKQMQITFHSKWKRKKTIQILFYVMDFHANELPHNKYTTPKNKRDFTKPDVDDDDDDDRQWTVYTGWFMIGVAK